MLESTPSLSRETCSLHIHSVTRLDTLFLHTVVLTLANSLNEYLSLHMNDVVASQSASLTMTDRNPSFGKLRLVDYALLLYCGSRMLCMYPTAFSVLFD